MPAVNFRSYNIIVKDKESFIVSKLKSFRPTIVFSLDEGMYIFSDKIQKVHSTIVLAGAGIGVDPIAGWFREQIGALSLATSPRDPNGRSEINLLPAAFHANLEATEKGVLADLMLVEVALRKQEDYIAHVDFHGKISQFHESVVAVNYLELDSGSSEEEESRDEGTDDKCVRDGFMEYGVAIPANFSDENTNRAFLDALRAKYPGKKCFLDRKKVIDKNFPWIFEFI